MQFCSRKREIAVECGFCRGPLCLIHVALDAFECSDNGDRGVAAVAESSIDIFSVSYAQNHHNFPNFINIKKNSVFSYPNSPVR